MGVCSSSCNLIKDWCAAKSQYCASKCDEFSKNIEREVKNKMDQASRIGAHITKAAPNESVFILPWEIDYPEGKICQYGNHSSYCCTVHTSDQPAIHPILDGMPLKPGEIIGYRI